MECTAADETGNVTTGSFTVEVVDDEPPTVTAPADIVVGTDDGLPSAVVTFTVGIEILVADIEASGFRRGAERRLVGPLEQGAKLLRDGNPDNDDAVCDKPAESAESLADALDDGDVTVAEAARLDAYTTLLRDGLGCLADD